MWLKSLRGILWAFLFLTVVKESLEVQHVYTRRRHRKVTRGRHLREKNSICPSDACKCIFEKHLVHMKCTQPLEKFPDFSAPPGVNIVYDSISITNQNLTQIPDNAFVNAKVKHLYLSGNNFEDRIENNAFAGLENVVETLILSDCNLTSLPAAESFHRLSALIILGLDNNRITKIPRKAFMHSQNITDISISRNQLSKISRDAFRGLSKLQRLKLSNNNLTMLPRYTFKGLNDLTVLDLSHNMLRRIVPGTFRSISKLTHLQMVNNRITVLDGRSLKGLSNLKYLKLDYNPLLRVSGGTFESTKRLNHLSLNIQNITELTPTTFNGLRKVVNLNLGELNRALLPDGIFGAMTNLERLSLLDYNKKSTGLFKNYFAHKLNLAQLRIWVVPIESCKIKWIQDLAARGVYLHGYSPEGNAKSCLKNKIKLPIRWPSFDKFPNENAETINGAHPNNNKKRNRKRSPRKKKIMKTKVRKTMRLHDKKLVALYSKSTPFMVIRRQLRPQRGSTNSTSTPTHSVTEKNGPFTSEVLVPLKSQHGGRQGQTGPQKISRHIKASDTATVFHISTVEQP